MRLVIIVPVNCAYLRIKIVSPRDQTHATITEKKVETTAVAHDCPFVVERAPPPGHTNDPRVAGKGIPGSSRVSDGEHIAWDLNPRFWDRRIGSRVCPQS